MTPTQQARILGFKAQLAQRGRAAFTDTANANGDPETVTIIVEDQAVLPDPDKPLQMETPVYVRVHCLAGAVKNPRKVGHFYEGTPVLKGRAYKVLEYQESASDAVSWKWLCEAERLDVVP